MIEGNENYEIVKCKKKNSKINITFWLYFTIKLYNNWDTYEKLEFFILSYDADCNVLKLPKAIQQNESNNLKKDAILAIIYKGFYIGNF